MQANSLTAKPHYLILDGLRGVASVIVVAFHILETHSTSHLDQIINHGYLAVDFFFLLSGFVIGYAYDDRWNSMSIGDFFKRRLVRLQPLVILGAIIGAIFFYFQDSAFWPMIATVPVWKMLIVMLIGFTMLPIPPSMDIRGWYETYPLNGPAWSLFFEYVANILYALGIRKWSKAALGVLVFLSAVALIHLGVTSTNGDVIGGWSLESTQLHVGLARVMYPFFAGLLLFRIGKMTPVNNAFLWCSLLITAVLAIPRIGGGEHLWMNGLYDALCIIFVFPLIVFLGASGTVTHPFTKRACKFFGDISYPLYISHYPLVYTYTAWVNDHKIPLSEAYPVSLFVYFSAIAIAWAALKWYDEPVRAWLKRKVKI
jgi:peptidoglycan/LPS O-acetylase OafA/YrhL